MNCRYFILAILFLPGMVASSMAAGKNVVLWVVDDQGKDAGCYGNPVIKTPHLDRLAAEGTRFVNAQCTTASCSASRSVILSGLYNHYNGQYGHQHAYHHFVSFDYVRSLPVLLAEGGYRTARIGKYHVAPDEVYQFQQVLPGNERSPVEMAENCRKFLAQDREKPFFLYFCTADPHRSGDTADDLPGKPNRFGNKPEGREYPGVTPVLYDPRDVLVPDFLPDTPECRAELAQYYQSVSRIDQGLGRLIQVLKDAGVYDDTMVIYISDNGIAFPGAKTTVYEPGINLPCIVRNPSQAKRGVVNRARINWADLAPTILDYAGLYDATTGGLRNDLGLGVPAGGKGKAQPYRFHGRSFLQVLEEEKPSGWDETYASHTFHEITMYYPMRVVRSGKYKLIWNIASGLPYPFASDLWDSPTWQSVYRQGIQARYGRRTIEAYIHRPPFELYDLEADPHEVENLAAKPEMAPRLQELKDRLKAFQQRSQDPWILKWQYE